MDGWESEYKHRGVGGNGHSRLLCGKEAVGLKLQWVQGPAPGALGKTVLLLGSKGQTHTVECNRKHVWQRLANGIKSQ